MSEFLTIGGTRVPIAAPNGADEEYQELGGEVVRSFSGSLLSTVKGRARVWRLQTPPLPDSEAQLLAAVLAHGSPLLCSGALIGSGPVSCYVRGVRTRPVAPLSRLRRVVEFELHEAAPMASPILFRLHAGQPLPHGASFSRASSATYFDRTGVLREAGPGVLRTTWRDGRPAYLIEPAATSAWSEPTNLAAPVWTKSGATITPDATVAPDGTTTADKLVEDTSTGAHAVRRTLPVTAGQPGAFAGFARANERPALSIYIRDASFDNYRIAVLDLTTGAIVNGASVGTVEGWRIDAERVGGGWYRWEVVGSIPGVTELWLEVRLNNGSASTYDGDGESGAYLWGLYAVPGLLAGSYPGPGLVRARDLLTADVTAQLAGRRSFALYHRFEERGTIILRNWVRSLSLESDAGTLRIWAPGSGAATYEAYFGDGRNAKIPSGTPALRQTVEHLMVVAEDGTLTLAQSIDGGPVVAATGSHGGYVPTGTVRLAWGSTVSGSNHGALGGRDLLVLDGADWTMDAVRRLVR